MKASRCLQLIFKYCMEHPWFEDLVAEELVAQNILKLVPFGLGALIHMIHRGDDEGTGCR